VLRASQLSTSTLEYIPKPLSTPEAHSRRNGARLREAKMPSLARGTGVTPRELGRAVRRRHRRTQRSGGQAAQVHPFGTRPSLDRPGACATDCKTLAAANGCVKRPLDDVPRPSLPCRLWTKNLGRLAPGPSPIRPLSWNGRRSCFAGSSSAFRTAGPERRMSAVAGDRAMSWAISLRATRPTGCGGRIRSSRKAPLDRSSDVFSWDPV